MEGQVGKERKHAKVEWFCWIEQHIAQTSYKNASWHKNHYINKLLFCMIASFTTKSSVTICYNFFVKEYLQWVWTLNDSKQQIFGVSHEDSLPSQFFPEPS